MTSFVVWSDRILRGLLVVGTVLLVACVVWQVTSRYLLGAPSTVTDEIGRLTLMWYAMFAAAYVLGQRRHLAINFFAELPVGPKRRAIAVLLTLLIALAATIMLIGGWQLASQTLDSGQVTPSLRMPMGYVYLAVPVSAIMMLIYCLDILRTALGPEARGPNDAIRALEE